MAKQKGGNRFKGSKHQRRGKNRFKGSKHQRGGKKRRYRKHRQHGASAVYAPVRAGSLGHLWGKPTSIL